VLTSGGCVDCRGLCRLCLIKRSQLRIHLAQENGRRFGLQLLFERSEAAVELKDFLLASVGRLVPFPSRTIKNSVGRYFFRRAFRARRTAKLIESRVSPRTAIRFPLGLVIELIASRFVRKICGYVSGTAKCRTARPQ